MIPTSVYPLVIDSAMTRGEALRNNLFMTCPSEIRISQVLLHLQYWSFDKQLHQGQLVVDEALATEVTAIFAELLEARFPIAKMIPIVRYEWDDERSMEDNNSSGFNFRTIAGSERLSWHAFGRAIDINPLFNPYISSTHIAPRGANYVVSRPGTLTPSSIVVQLFKAHGWQWGGAWHDRKDYQHFEKPFSA